MTLPPRSQRYISFFEPFQYLYGQWSTSGSDRGIAHFFTLQEYNRGSGRKKNKRTKRTICLGLTQMQKESYVTLCMCRLTLVWVISENSTTLLECRFIFPHCGWTLSHADSSLRCLVSTGHSCHPSPTAPRAPFSNSLLAFLHHFRSRRDLKSKTLCLVSRQNRQGNRLLGGPPT